MTQVVEKEQLTKKIKERTEVDKEDRWNVEALYSSMQEWESDFKIWAREGKTPRFPEILEFKDTLAKNAQQLRALLEICLNFERHLSKLFTYAHLRHDEDVAQDENKKAFARASSILHDFRLETAWIEPEILKIPDAKMKEFLNSETLQEYRIYLEKILRMKPHTLSADKEELLAIGGKALQTASHAFGAFNNADLKFPPIVDGQGNQRELTHGTYLLYMRDQDRVLRERAFKTVHHAFFNFENTLCELINGQIQGHVFEQRARGYSTCLEAALFPHQIDPAVYTSLIQAVRGRLGSLHRYMSLRKKLLKYDELHLYDMHVPLVSDVGFSMKYQDAEKLVVQSVGALGKEYQECLKKGLTTERWVDRYENARKRSGAYSSGCYDSMPYILMNYQGAFNDVMTLAHEAGHSMHSLLSEQHQSYQYSQYPIFVAEVASTLNEELLIRHLTNELKEKQQKCFLINQRIDGIRSTLFRQAMFAEFELRLHEWAEQGIPLTPLLLKTEYRKLNADYFGPEVVIDEQIDIEWARIPHFYYNFYVYQYATGISAALTLADRLQKEGDAAQNRYLQFLSSGCSQFPLDLLKIAGVDMRKTEAIEKAIDHFDELVGELAKFF